jgi:hypothetical protein
VCQVVEGARLVEQALAHVAESTMIERMDGLMADDLLG